MRPTVAALRRLCHGSVSTQQDCHEHGRERDLTEAAGGAPAGAESAREQGRSKEDKDQ
jgi:hypothetical protein